MLPRGHKPTIDERRLAEVMATFEPDHPAYLSVDYSDREIEFVRDLEVIAGRCGLSPLSRRQSAWLRDIHERIGEQIRRASIPAMTPDAPVSTAQGGTAVKERRHALSQGEHARAAGPKRTEMEAGYG